ncbi:hypothetical protein MA12_gp11 [Pectobacterium phage MA12]|uniref:Uncharacterized protein n=1 Tax=Pectobacterium phage MA12 TaxID=2686474 RepID=A0A6B9RH06_9CAUD|nr:hypothetical protein JT357_gp11 [Pectobacterium phage MA12]QHI00838.1 hypothetical protein MA12_gp11 [Pectobacterium phage MA12]
MVSRCIDRRARVRRLANAEAVGAAISVPRWPAALVPSGLVVDGNAVGDAWRGIPFSRLAGGGRQGVHDVTHIPAAVTRDARLERVDDGRCLAAVQRAGDVIETQGRRRVACCLMIERQHHGQVGCRFMVARLDG